MKTYYFVVILFKYLAFLYKIIYNITITNNVLWFKSNRI